MLRVRDRQRLPHLQCGSAQGEGAADLHRGRPRPRRDAVSVQLLGAGRRRHPIAVPAEQSDHLGRPQQGAIVFARLRHAGESGATQAGSDRRRLGGTDQSVLVHIKAAAAARIRDELEPIRALRALPAQQQTNFGLSVSDERTRFGELRAEQREESVTDGLSRFRSSIWLRQTGLR